MAAIKIKICGMRDAENIADIAALRPDYMGFVFYHKSPRYVGKDFSPVWTPEMAGITKTAVLVNEPLDSALELLEQGGFDAAQLHGEESPEYCRQIREKGKKVVKSFGIDADFDFNQLKAYEQEVDCFLFDAKTSIYGGSGKTFGWEQLQRYPLSVPFFLSGGLEPGNLEDAMKLAGNLPLHALDLNSRFETAPGVKNIDQIAEAIRFIRK